jgi:hypothetical protein
VKLELFSSLVEALYDAALNPTDWPRLAQVFARAFDAENCAIFQLILAQGSAGILGHTEHFDAKAVSAYDAYYHQKDLRAIRSATAGMGQAMLGTDVVGEAEFLESEFFVDFIRPRRLGFYWDVGGTIAVEQQVMGNGTFSVTSTKNANGTIMAASTGTGTYTVAADGTLTITDAEGDVYDGAISADGNALVLASVASQQNPAIFVGVRQ